MMKLHFDNKDINEIEGETFIPYQNLLWNP